MIELFEEIDEEKESNPLMLEQEEVYFSNHKSFYCIVYSANHISI
jgi:hypothetical protein